MPMAASPIEKSSERAIHYSPINPAIHYSPGVLHLPSSPLSLSLSPRKKRRGEISKMSDDGSGAGSGGGGMQKAAEYFGWVYHLGVNTIGFEYCHLRFLHVKGKHALMYKRDPHDYLDIKPIRKGVISHTLMVEDLGRRKVNNGDLYVLRLYNRLDETQKGELACAEPGDVQKWMEAFDQAKQQADSDLLRGRSRQRLNVDNELNFEGHRPRVRRGLRNLVRIGKGPEVLLRQASDLGSNARVDTYFEEATDAIDGHGWKLVRTLNGIRIFEDATESKKGSFLVKSVGMVDGSLDAVFETILNLDQHKRYQWDVLTADLELVDTVDGHYDVVHGIYNPKYLSRWYSKTDFVFSRQWFRSQDGSYTILQSPAVHKKCPKQSGYQRMKINPSTWEIRKLESSHSSNATKCIVTQMLEIHCSFWDRWKKVHSSSFEKTIPYALLCQVAGLKEYFAAHPTLDLDLPSTVVQSTVSSVSGGSLDFEDSDVNDEFFDAIVDTGLLEDEDSSDDDDFDVPKRGATKLKNVSWALAGLALRRKPALAAISELDTTVPPVIVDPKQFHGSLNQARDDAEKNCWSSPSGKSFMVRGKTYPKDYRKVVGGDPLLKLIAVDWWKAENTLDKIALHPKCPLQSEAGKKLPFVLVINLQIPAKPNYNLVLYYSAERPICKESLLGKFVNGSDTFRDSRFKLIPSIVQGYWMVKRAVGTKACLLGKAVTCRYLRQDNFLEIDVDIGSSSVARSVIGLVLGYVTSIVVDLAILVEGKEENELPEYILGAVRLSCLKPESAVQL